MRAGKNQREGLAADAIRRVLSEDRQDLLRFIARRISNAQDAEEVLQRFILKALDRAGDLRDVTSVRGWLSKVLASTIADHLRRARRAGRREVALDETALSVPVPDPEIEQAICACLYKLLPTLVPAHAQVIWRIDILGDRREDIAKELGVSANNLAVRLHRARMALKKRLQEMCLSCPVEGFFDCGCEPKRSGQISRNRPREAASLSRR
jgi:RNA polymerase sigma factor (sigma-70 family)